MFGGISYYTRLINSEISVRENIIELAFGRFWYDDHANKTNGEFNVATHDLHGHMLYEAKFLGMPDTRARISKLNSLTSSSIPNGSPYAANSMRQSVPHRRYASAAK